MKDTEHPMPGDFNWWASSDGGEHFTVGPCSTREAVIEEAIDDGLGDSYGQTGFMIAECRDGNVDLARYFSLERWFDDAEENMTEDGCGSDEDGERHPLDEVTTKQAYELEAAIRTTIREWQKRHQLPLRSYWFPEMRNEEDIQNY